MQTAESSQYPSLLSVPRLHITTNEASTRILLTQDIPTTSNIAIMQAEASAPSATQTQSTARPRQRRPRGPKRGRGGANASESLNFRPASVAPPTAHVSSENQAAPEASSSDNASRNRPSRRGRGRGGRGPQPDRRTADGRRFGGQLTQPDSATTQAQLQAEAAEFVLGQQNASKPKTKAPQKQPRQQKRRMSKSQAPDIATRTHEDIDNGHYECPICTSEVQRNSKVWACHTCWTAFHLTCIKKWSTNQGSTVTVPNAQGEAPPPRQWRCPGCNLPKDDLPKNYTCWCGKEDDPKSLTGIPPHSCGQTCGRERARKCPHPCQLTCHAGPCPPCTHMGPTQICFCGKHEVTKRCSDTDYDSGWSCGEVCDEMMPCGEHTCPRPCHEGLCGACEERVPAKCYCGQVEKELLCADRGDEKESRRTHLLKATNLSWKAGQARSSAEIFASASLTVEFTSARRSATRRRHMHRIARDRRTLLHIVHVERRHSRRSRMQQESRVRTISQAVHSHVGRHSHAAIYASRSAILEAALIASKLSTFSADVVAHPLNRCATKVRSRRLNACAFAGPR